MLFQGMQSDYTELCWKLVRGEKPAYTITAGGAPVLLAYDRAAVSRVLKPIAAPQPSKPQSASSETNKPTR